MVPSFYSPMVARMNSSMSAFSSCCGLKSSAPSVFVGAISFVVDISSFLVWFMCPLLLLLLSMVADICVLALKLWWGSLWVDHCLLLCIKYWRLGKTYINVNIVWFLQALMCGTRYWRGCFCCWWWGSSGCLWVWVGHTIVHCVCSWFLSLLHFLYV